MGTYEAPAVADPTTLICAYCSNENDHSRRFCRRCGQWLVVPSVQPAVPPAKLKQRLVQRWFGERNPYSGALSQATIGFRVVVVLLVLVVVTAVLTVAGQHPIRRVHDAIEHVRGTGRMSGVTATSTPPGSPTAHSAPWAVDNVRDRGWSTSWATSGPGDPSVACATTPIDGSTSSGVTSSTLTIGFAAPADVREVGFEAGLSDDAERRTHWQPRTLELRWVNGGCQVVNLENQPGLQRFTVNEGLVPGLTVSVIAGYPPVDPGSGQLDIGEITFWQR